MKNWLKLNLIVLIFSIFLSPQAIAADLILPLPKPVVDKEIKEKTAKKKEIYPQKKPTKKVNVTEDTTQDAVEEITDREVIYPQKKPVIFKKKVDKAVTKSVILSSEDLKIS